MSEEATTARPVRPPISERLRGALEETLAWAQNEGEARVTLPQQDGSRIGPQNMTRAQMEELAQTAPPPPTNEAFTLIQELLDWAGREPSSEDKEQVETLRRRATAFLHQPESIAG